MAVPAESPSELLDEFSEIYSRVEGRFSDGVCNSMRVEVRKWVGCKLSVETVL